MITVGPRVTPPWNLVKIPELGISGAFSKRNWLKTLELASAEVVLSLGPL